MGKNIRAKKEISSETDNYFDEVRGILAFIVLVAQTSALATAQQLYEFTKFFDLDFVVNGFFVSTDTSLLKVMYPAIMSSSATRLKLSLVH